MDFMSFYWQVTSSPGSFASFSTGLCSLLFIRSDQPCCAVYPPLRPYLHITLLSLCTVCWSFFEAWFSWWDVAAIQRAFYFSLLALKHGGGQAAGLRASDKRLRDDGRGKEGPFSVFLGHEWSDFKNAGGSSWFNVLQQISYILSVIARPLSEAC